MTHAILGTAALAIGGVVYGLVKHITLAQVKAEIAKIEGEIVAGTLAAEVQAIIATLVARIKSIL